MTKAKSEANIAGIIISGRHISSMAGYSDFSSEQDSEIDTFDNDLHEVHIDHYLGEERDEDAFKQHVTEKISEIITVLIKQSKKIEVLVIGVIGPLTTTDPRLENDFNSGYGSIINDGPYKYWSNINFAYIVYQVFEFNNLPPPRIIVRSDASMIALGEHRLRLRRPDLQLSPSSLRMDYGLEKRDAVLVYLKLSADIAVGVAHRGTIWRGRLHPLAGALQIQIAGARQAEQDENDRSASYKNIENLLGAHALSEQLDKRGLPSNIHDVSFDDHIWSYVVDLTSALCVNIACLYTPSLIVLGGRTTSDLYSTKNMSNTFINAVNNKTLLNIKSSLPSGIDYPELDRADGFVQGAVHQLSGVYGCLVFAEYKAKQVND